MPRKKAEPKKAAPKTKATPKKKAAEPKATPEKKAAPEKKATPKKAAEPKKTAAKKAAEPRKSTSKVARKKKAEPKAAPKKKATPEKKAAPKKKAEPKAAPKKKAAPRKAKEPIELRHQIEDPPRKVIALAFSPTGLLAAGDLEGLITLVDSESGHIERHLKGHRGPVTGVRFAHDGEHLISTGADNTLRLWNIASGEFLQDLTGAVSTTPRARTAKHQFALSSHNGHSQGTLDVDCHPDGLIASGGQDTLVKVWRENNVVRTFDWHQDHVTSVRFRPGHNDVLSSSRDMTLRLWSVETGAMLHKYLQHTDEVMCAVWTSAERFASGGMSGALLVWDAENEKVVARLESSGSAIRALALGPNGKNLYVGFESGDIACYTLKTKKMTARIEGHILALRSLAITSDGKCLASGGIDGTLRLWSIT